MYTQKAMHAQYLDISFIDHQKGSSHLANEFLDWGYHQHVIFETQEKNYKKRREKILKLIRLRKRNENHAGHYRSGKNAYTCKRRNGLFMNFTLIRNVV